VKNRDPFPRLVGGTLAVTTLATFIMQDSWLIWIPVLLALAVVIRIRNGLRG